MVFKRVYNPSYSTQIFFTSRASLTGVKISTATLKQYQTESRRSDRKRNRRIKKEHSKAGKNSERKLKTRTIDIPVPLIEYLNEYQPLPNPYNLYLFPSRERKALSRSMADKLLRAACQLIGIEGVSTHSFRRTA